MDPITRLRRSSYSAIYYWTHPWKYLRDAWRDLRDFIQRGRRGYADCDVWDFDVYLSTIIVGGLGRLRAGCSYPGRGDAATPEAWDGILLEMIDGFKAHVRLVEEFNACEYQYLMAKIIRGQELFIQWFHDLWD